MIKLLINFSIIIFIYSCEMQNDKSINEIFDEKKDKILQKRITQDLNKNNLIKYIVGDPYFIEGVEYIPAENYNYDKVGLATFYEKELHNTKTINNDFNKVTELLGRHKTLPLPSVVRVTNLDNGLSLIVKINDRHNDNSSLIQLSRKSAQLLKFYSNKITKVRVEILSDPSKQLKVVSESMSESSFNDTIKKAPSPDVSLNLINTDNNKIVSTKITESPIEIGFSSIANNNLILKIYGFKSYNEAKLIISKMETSYKFTVQNEGNSYSLLIGPLENVEANNLVLSFISKGYKNNEFILE